MNNWLKIANHLDNLNKKAAMISRWSVLLMLGIGLWNVVGRYLGSSIGINLSSNRLIEAQWYLFDIIFLLGMGWTLKQKNHVNVDILQNRLSLRSKKLLFLLGTIFLLIPFTLGVTVISIKPMLLSWKIAEASPDPNGLPRYWIKTLIPIGFSLLTLQGIAEIIRLIDELKISFGIPRINKSG